MEKNAIQISLDFLEAAEAPYKNALRQAETLLNPMSRAPCMCALREARAALGIESILQERMILS